MSKDIWFRYACYINLITAPKEVEINLRDLDHLFGLDAYFMLNHQVGELVSIDEHKAWITNAVGEEEGIRSEFARSDEDPLPITA